MPARSRATSTGAGGRARRASSRSPSGVPAPTAASAACRRASARPGATASLAAAARDQGPPSPSQRSASGRRAASARSRSQDRIVIASCLFIARSPRATRRGPMTSRRPPGRPAGSASPGSAETSPSARDPEDLGHAIDRQVDDVVEDDDRALVERQAPERPLQPVALVDEADGVGRDRLDPGKRVDVRDPARRSLALGVAGTDDEPVQPGLEPRRVAEARAGPARCSAGPAGSRPRRASRRPGSTTPRRATGRPTPSRAVRRPRDRRPARGSPDSRPRPLRSHASAAGSQPTGRSAPDWDIMACSLTVRAPAPTRRSARVSRRDRSGPAAM